MDKKINLLKIKNIIFLKKILLKNQNQFKGHFFQF